MYTIESHAKINLFLKVTGKRSDGYHLLCSAMAYLDLRDNITIIPKEQSQPTLSITGSFGHIISNERPNNNLAFKALRLMQKRYNIQTNFHIKIEKNIPIAAGLGGGSSNAAAVLNFCNNYFNLKLTPDELMSEGLKIGADVPFFLQPHTSICEGIGEIITPITFQTNSQPIEMAIISLDVFISSAAAYKHSQFKPQDYSSIKNKICSKEIATSDLIATVALGNDLYPHALNQIPQLHNIIVTATQMGEGLATCAMSGSGPTLFLFHPEKEKLNHITLKLNKHYPVNIIHTKLLTSIKQNHFTNHQFPWI